MPAPSSTAVPPTALEPAELAAALSRLRARPPLVQCLTNIVAAQWTANVLLAIGASPAMVDNPQEAGAFAVVADAVLVNLGTPQTETVAAMTQAVRGATDAGTPWVLDPVGAGGLLWRTGIAHELVSVGAPAIVRGNASEVLALGGGSGGRGTDSLHTPEATAPVARELAGTHGTVVAVSGAVDHLTDGTRVVRVHNGSALLTRVTGAGCALGALMAGFCAVVEDPLVAAVAATAALTVAAEQAAQVSHGPGSFAVALLDALSLLSPETLADRVRLS